MSDSPSGEAFKNLEWLDLGPDVVLADSLDEIKIYDDFCPGNDSRIVTAPDNLS